MAALGEGAILDAKFALCPLNPIFIAAATRTKTYPARLYRSEQFADLIVSTMSYHEVVRPQCSPRRLRPTSKERTPRSQRELRDLTWHRTQLVEGKGQFSLSFRKFAVLRLNMQNPRTIRSPRSFTHIESPSRVTALILGAMIGLCGCGGGSAYSPAPPPVAQNASVTGQYNLVLTSSTGHGTTIVYTNFTQTGSTFTGAADTLVCLSNDLSQCEGGNSPLVSITPSGTVKGADVTLMISFPSTTGTDSVTMVGTAAGINLAGSYADSLGDAGTWAASPAASLSGTYSGTFNSISNPLPIAPTIMFTLAQDAKFNLTGTATIMNSPCISSLTVSGQAIGGAFTLTDAAREAVIVALPTGNTLTFSYKFGPTAASCPGDGGRGELTNPNPWNY